MSLRPAVVVVVYSAVMALATYLVLDRLWDDIFPYSYLFLALIHFVAGFLAARWWALLLPAIPLLLSLPAGYPESQFEALPVAALFTLFAPAWVLLTAAGVTLARRRHEHVPRGWEQAG